VASGLKALHKKVGSSRASAAFHTGHGALLAGHEKYSAEARPWSSRAAGLLVDDMPFPGYEAVLVRPDGYVCATVPGADLTVSLSNWFGTVS
jgi:hypothetical protein